MKVKKQTLTLFTMLVFTLIGCKEQPNKENDQSNTGLTLKDTINNTPTTRSPVKEKAPIVEKTVITETVKKTEPTAEVTYSQLGEMKFEDYVKLDTRDKILEVFGAEELSEGESYYEEGTVKHNHTIVTNPVTTHKIKYLWNDDNTLKFVEAFYHKKNEYNQNEGIQMINSNCGVNLGMSLEELVKWNGSDFDFNAFGWDREGIIENQKNNKFNNCNLEIQLGIEYNAETIKDLSGSMSINTSNEKLKNEKIYIAHITFYAQGKE